MWGDVLKVLRGSRRLWLEMSRGIVRRRRSRWLPQPRTQALWLAVLFSTACSASERVLFEDDFSISSRGILERNVVVDPPPKGMGYTTDTPYGFRLQKWFVRTRAGGDDTGRALAQLGGVRENHYSDRHATIRHQV